MKNLRCKFILLMVFALSNPILWAQGKDTTVNRNVTVEREYKPVIQDAGKINSVPQVLEPVVDKTKPNYSEFNSPLVVDFKIQNLEAAELTREKRKPMKQGFARLGMGNYMNTLADFAFPLVKQNDLRLDFTLNHSASFAPVKMHSNTKAALSLDKYLNNSNLYAGINGGHETFNYYGNRFKSNILPDYKIVNDTLMNNHSAESFTEKDEVKGRPKKTMSFADLINKESIRSNTFWRLNAYAGLRSLPLATDFRYTAEVNYKLFSPQIGINEQIINAVARFDTEIDVDRLGLDVDASNISYRNNKILDDSLGTYSIFTFNPYYSIERDTWKVRIGMKATFKLEGTDFFPSPDLSAEWQAIPKVMLMYGGFGGNYKQNTMSEIFAENPYLYSTVRVDDTYTPYRLYLGVKVKPVYNLLVDFYLDYSEISNQYFYANKSYIYSGAGAINANDSIIYTNKFNVVYQDAGLFKVGLRANYNIRNLVNLELKGAYNGWDVTPVLHAWNMPKWEASFSSNYRVNRNLNFSANLFFESERFAKFGDLSKSMAPRIDLNVGGSYNWLSWMSVFVKANNLLNRKDQIFYGYESQGLNVLAGATFSF